MLENAPVLTFVECSEIVAAMGKEQWGMEADSSMHPGVQRTTLIAKLVSEPSETAIHFIGVRFTSAVRLKRPLQFRAELPTGETPESLWLYRDEFGVQCEAQHANLIDTKLLIG